MQFELLDFSGALAVASNGEFFISGGGPSDRSLCIWDLKERRCIKRIQEAHSECLECGDDPEYKMISAVAISHDCKLAFSSSTDNAIKVWDLKEFTCVHTFKNAHKGKP